jgi:hypothetical protein
VITKIIEATNNFNWGKFMVARFDEQEWALRSQIDDGACLLSRLGWTPEHVWVLDLQTGEGALFSPHGYAIADLNKHKIWVCPLYQPFLEWLYKQDLQDILKLPMKVELPKAEGALYGYRRDGTQK